MKRARSKSDAWYQLEHKHNLQRQVDADGVAYLTATQINEFFEPRLVTKIESEKALPQFLRDSGLRILPLTRNQFAVGRFEVFEPLPAFDYENPQLVAPSKSLALNNGPNSEAVGVLTGIETGVFETFLNDGPTTLATMGRMSTGDFDFTVDGFPSTLKVRGSQMEIDAGLETKSSLAIIEAKTTNYDDFLIRQLYYPFRRWHEVIGREKAVRPVFVQIQGDVYALAEYVFSDPSNYSSIVLVKSQVIRVKVDQTFRSIVNEALAKPLIEPVPGIPFPQADSVSRVLQVLNLALQQSGVSKLQLTLDQGFVPRQADYYMNAAIYLGMISAVPIEGIYQLTRAGYAVINGSSGHVSNKIAARLSRDKFVREAILSIRTSRTKLSKAEVRRHIVKLIEEAHDLGVSKATIPRRATTIASWAFWVTDRMND